MQKAGIEGEPLRNRFDNLGTAQTCVESAEQNELQILAIAFGNQLVAQLGSTESFPRSLIDASELDADNGVAANQSFLRAPFEEAADDHEITEGGTGRQ